MPKFDLAKTTELAALFAVDRGSRNEDWIEKFYSAIVDASLMCGDPQVVAGPDQYPYFQLGLPNGAFESYCISHILDSALENGFGACVFSDLKDSTMPEFVFSYGDLLSYKLYGHFRGDPNEETAVPSSELRKEVLSKSTQLLVGLPSEAYLPTVTRKVIGDFMRTRLRHSDPKICLIEDPQLRPSKNLAVNIDIEDVNGDGNQLREILLSISWFLPRSYAIMSAPDTLDPASLIALP